MNYQEAFDNLLEECLVFGIKPNKDGVYNLSSLNKPRKDRILDKLLVFYDLEGVWLPNHIETVGLFINPYFLMKHEEFIS